MKKNKTLTIITSVVAAVTAILLCIIALCGVIGGLVSYWRYLIQILNIMIICACIFITLMILAFVAQYPVLLTGIIIQKFNKEIDVYNDNKLHLILTMIWMILIIFIIGLFIII